MRAAGRLEGFGLARAQAVSDPENKGFEQPRRYRADAGERRSAGRPHSAAQPIEGAAPVEQLNIARLDEQGAVITTSSGRAQTDAAVERVPVSNEDTVHRTCPWIRKIKFALDGGARQTEPIDAERVHSKPMFGGRRVAYQSAFDPAQ